MVGFKHFVVVVEVEFQVVLKNEHKLEHEGMAQN